ncbi:putative ATP-dependent DNA helicase Q1 [Leptopilina heterotoma]|uniref:putative ATP-dependent DNA helicase Q1 n=1 Tax=Leptopilina heterotoma TaxID=63436 RepID=UPI001CA7E65A|nr:putative ATP-dependent DNA helicase Q1 [Leptopilina heterotoma]
MAQQLWIRKLKDKFRINKFRKFQEEIITNIKNGNDGLFVMPTGSGKSLCFQFPTYLDNYDDNGNAVINKRTAIIISPLLALIEDQDNYLQQLRFHTLKVTGSNSEANALLEDNFSRADKINDIDFIFITPEKLFKDEEVLKQLQKANKWEKLSHFSPHPMERNSINTDHSVMITAANNHHAQPSVLVEQQQGHIANVTQAVTIADDPPQQQQPPIVEEDNIPNRDRLKATTITRDEIPLLQTELQLDQNCIVNYNDGESGIIYCGTIEDTEYYKELLRMNEISCKRYHAKLSKQDKNEIFLRWKENVIQVLCATIALGMGIDKSDTRFVINTTVSNSLANYCQETGRVGRDNIPGDCILFYHYEDIFAKMKLFISDGSYTREMKVKHIKEMLLLLGYCENQQQCRYKFIIKHFDPLAEKSLDPNWQCRNCDICKNIFLPHKHRIDISKLATDMKSLIINLENTKIPRNKRLNINDFVPFLLGKTTTTNRLPHFCQNVNFGCLTSWKDGQIWRLFANLLGLGVLSLDFSPDPMERNSLNKNHSVMITAANHHNAQPPVLVEQSHIANVTRAVTIADDPPQQQPQQQQQQYILF